MSGLVNVFLMMNCFDYGLSINGKQNFVLIIIILVSFMYVMFWSQHKEKLTTRDAGSLL